MHQWSQNLINMILGLGLNIYRTLKNYLMLYKKVYNYQANQQQAKHDAKWRPILSLRAVLAWKSGWWNSNAV